jgi:hypothetical protein
MGILRAKKTFHNLPAKEAVSCAEHPAGCAKPAHHPGLDAQQLRALTSLCFRSKNTPSSPGIPLNLLAHPD